MFADLERQTIRQLTSGSSEVIEMGISSGLGKIVQPTAALTDAVVTLADPTRFFRLTPSLRLTLYQVFSAVCPEKLTQLTKEGLPVADGTGFTASAINALYLDAPRIARANGCHYVSSAILFAGLMCQRDECGAKLKDVLRDDSSRFLATLWGISKPDGSLGPSPILCRPTDRLAKMLQRLREKLAEVDTKDLVFTLVDYRCDPSNVVLEVRLAVERMGLSLEEIDRAL